MKKLNNFFRNFNWNSLWILPFIFILSWVTIYCILESQVSHPFNPLLLILLIIIYIVIISIIYKKLSKKFAKLNDKKTFIFYVIVVALMTALQFIIGYKVRTNPTWDLGIVMKAANEIITNGQMTNMAGYFANFPNNIFNALFLAVVYKFFGIFGISTWNVPALIVNVIFMQLAIYYMFQIARKLFGNYSACFVLVLAFMFVPFYPYSPICYTDTLSMFIPVALIYYLMKITDNTDSNINFIYCFIIGVLIFLAYRIKVTALIVMIAYFIIIILRMVCKRFKLKRALLAIFIIAFAFFSINLVYVKVVDHSNVLGYKYKDTKKIPYTHWIMMGTYNMGAFSSDEYDYTFSFPDYESRKEANIKKIKERLKERKTQGTIKFLNYKLAVQTWGSGTYDFETILPSNMVKKSNFHEFFLTQGKYFEYVFYYCNTFHFSMLILIIISLIASLTNKKTNYLLNVMQLSMFGLMLFLMLWETRSRYMLNYIPIYILLMTSGIIWLSQNYKKVLKRIFIGAKGY